MKMTKIEKCFINRKKKAEGNIKKVQHALRQIDIERTNTVLELGCGVGFVSTYLADAYDFVVYGTDYDVEQIELAKKLQPEMKHLHFQVEDAVKLSFKDSSIDLVLSQNVFHHIPRWEDAIREIVRVIRSGGYFIWLDLTFPEIVKKIFRPFVKNYGLYTTNDIKTVLKDNGFITLYQDRLTHGPLKQDHFVLQLR
jgi:ubiquinone/menaquinone biosynthesis C-methylase UbiE